ncbi:MAG: PaaI family thioesterase [Acidimicrobiia bacterium]
MTLSPEPRDNWNPFQPVEDSHRARKHALVHEVKRVVEHSALLDIGTLSDAALDDLTAEARHLADRLEASPRFEGLANLPLPDMALVERSPFSGRANPLATPVSMVLGDDGVTRGSAVWTAAYEGPIGHLHGGFVAAAFDDLMGMAQIASGIGGYTGTLTVKMLRPTPLHVRIDYEAAVDRIEGRKIYVLGTSRHGDELLAECEIVFIAPVGGFTAEARLAAEQMAADD